VLDPHKGIAGRYTLRLCVLSHRTHGNRIDEAVELTRTSTSGSQTTTT
jgi:hypothetical protein